MRTTTSVEHGSHEMPRSSAAIGSFTPGERVRETMIRKCTSSDFGRIYEIINNGAQVYKEVIPAEYWKEPYMSRDELRRELDDGIEMWGYEKNGKLIGVMGIQHRQNVTLIRHAYVCTTKQKQGVGGELLSHFKELMDEPILIATWSNAIWAIRFYEKHGFRLVSREEGDRLQRKYWSSPEIKIKTSVVLADEKWSKSLFENSPIMFLKPFFDSIV